MSKCWIVPIHKLAWRQPKHHYYYYHLSRLSLPIMNHNPSRRDFQHVSMRFMSKYGYDNDGDGDDNKKSGLDYHAMFQEQMLELNAEREALFGNDEQFDLDDNKNNNITFQKFQNQKNMTKDNGQRLMVDEIMKQEREELYGFTDDDRKAWGSYSEKSNMQGKQDFSILLQQIQDARTEQENNQQKQSEKEQRTSNSDTNNDNNDNLELTHVTKDGTSVQMVNVGNKNVTQRMAKAQTKVIFPPDVVAVLNDRSSSGDNEIIGPKGPILSTAQLAGIMAAKKTSDLIPLCHPLPLDSVNIEFTMIEPHILLIECTCHVTHKTGVEMEALVGSSVAALTVYDMVKAISHEVQITDTRLISKAGGKRNVGTDNEVN